MFNALIYGEAGGGKTPFCGTLEACPQTSPCLFLDVDQGAMSIIAEPKPTILSIVKWEQMQAVYTHLKEATSGDGGVWEKLAKYLSKETGTEVPSREYKSVVIDSATELEYICRQLVIVEESSRKEHDPEVPEQRDYLKTGERMKRLVRHFRDLPIAFVMTAGVRDLKDDRDGIVRHFPAFQPGLSKDIVRMMDLIMYMNVVFEDKTPFRTLQTHLSVRIIARDRSQKLEPMLKKEKFYFKDILSKVLP